MCSVEGADSFVVWHAYGRADSLANLNYCWKETRFGATRESTIRIFSSGLARSALSRTNSPSNLFSLAAFAGLQDDEVYRLS
jgi:hypothetical protein